MQVLIPCAECGVQFTAKRITQKFCKRLCFRKSYNAKQVELNNVKKPIMHICTACGERTELDFDPIENLAALRALVCSKCGTSHMQLAKDDFLSDTPFFRY